MFYFWKRTCLSFTIRPIATQRKTWKRTKISGSLSQQTIFGNCRKQLRIKGSIEPTHGSVCSDVRKLQSMDVLELRSTKADWNTKCHFPILAYIYSNVLAVLTSCFIQILSCRERLDLDSQRTKKCTFHLDFRGERVENKEK